MGASYHHARALVARTQRRTPAPEIRYVRGPLGVMHSAHRQGDEWACSCGKRWPVGEEHPK